MSFANRPCDSVREILNIWIDQVDLSKRPFTLYGKESEDSEEITTIIKADTLIISTGAPLNGSECRARLRCRKGSAVMAFRLVRRATVFSSASKPIVVVGGGDTAMEEALVSDQVRIKGYSGSSSPRVSSFEDHAGPRTGSRKDRHYLEYRDQGDPRDQGKRRIESVVLYNTKTNETSELPTQGVFIAIGHKPNTDLFKGVLDMDEVGYLITEGRTMKTNVPGVFACGDAQDAYYRQAITAAGTGCMAAIDAERFLAEHGHEAERNTATNW